MESDFDRAVREAIEAVNYDMIPVLAKLSPEQRFAMTDTSAEYRRMCPASGSDGVNQTGNRLKAAIIYAKKSKWESPKYGGHDVDK